MESGESPKRAGRPPRARVSEPALPGSGTAELLAAAFDSNPAGLAILAGADLRFERVNASYRAITPQPEVDPVGRRFDEVWPGDDGFVAAFRRVLATREPMHDEDCSVCGAGSRRRFSMHASRVETGGRAALLLVVWETTSLWEARFAAEQAAWAAQRHASELDAMVSALPDGFALYGPRGEVLRANAVAERLLGLSPADRALPAAARWGRAQVATADGKVLAYEESPLARALAGEAVHSAHLRVEVGGVSTWILESAAPIRSPGGTVWGAVTTVTDESAVHALEEERDDLVRMISHDLRTPLNSVLAQAHMLRLAPADPAKVYDRARSITRNCERMAAMIQDLLDATLLEAGELRVTPRAVDLGAFVAEVIERQRGGLAVDRVSAVTRGEVPRVAADPERLERILVNLVSNALKYSPPQGPVTIEVGPAEGGATLAVTDRGVGIAPEDLPHVFERFFRARGARQPEGLGLGLYISRLLVHAHGGRIEVESRLGQGSTFRVFLPSHGALRPEGAKP